MTPKQHKESAAINTALMALKDCFAYTHAILEKVCQRARGILSGRLRQLIHLIENQTLPHHPLTPPKPCPCPSHTQEAPETQTSKQIQFHTLAAKSDAEARLRA